MTERKKVKCPECGEVKTSRGSDTFRHCGTTHKIDENLAKDNSSDKLDPQGALGVEEEEEPEAEPEEEEESEAEPEEEEHEYNCSDCGQGFDRKLLKCPKCGKRFDWSAVA